MDDFIPPRPPEDLETDVNKLDVNNIVVEKKVEKKGFFSKLFGNSKEDVKKEEVTRVEQGADVVEKNIGNNVPDFEEGDVDDLFSANNKLDDLKIDDYTEPSEEILDTKKVSKKKLSKEKEISDDFFTGESETQKNDEFDFAGIDEDQNVLKNDKKSELDFSDFDEDKLYGNSKKKKSKEVKSDIEENDLDNIRTALGISNEKSIRAQFEDNPENFEEKKVKKTSKTNPKKDEIDIDFVLAEPIKAELLPKPKQPKNKAGNTKNKLNTENKAKNKVAKKVNLKKEKKGSMAKKKEIKKPLPVPTSKKKKDVVQEKKDKKMNSKKLNKSDENLKLKPISRGFINPKVVKEKKVEEQDDLPSFDNQELKSKSALREDISKKVNPVFAQAKKLTEAKIELLISQAATKKKYDLLDKSREKVVLLNFENKVKKTVESALKSINLEEDKLINKYVKKAEVLEKKVNILEKKQELIVKKEEEFNKTLEEKTNVVAELDKQIKSKELDLTKSEKRVELANSSFDKIEKNKTFLLAEIDQIKETLNLAKVDSKKELAELKKKFDVRKTALDSEYKSTEENLEKLKKELVIANKELTEKKSQFNDSWKTLSDKEKEIDRKTDHLKKLIEEEKLILGLLKKSGNISDEVSDDSDDDLEELSDFEKFEANLDKCSVLVNKGLIDDAKILYNELRSQFLSANFESKQMASLKNKLKVVYASILKKS